MNEKIFTFHQFIEKNKNLDRWPHNINTLRSIYRRRETNDMEKAFIKIGRRILIDEDKFYSRD